MTEHHPEQSAQVRVVEQPRMWGRRTRHGVTCQNSLVRLLLRRPCLVYAKHLNTKLRATPSSIVKPLIVRLPNHLGDACMALPALDLLADRGFALTLAGRPWAKDLFSAYPWTVVSFASSRIQALRDDQSRIKDCC